MMISTMAGAAVEMDESAETQHVRADGAEATLQILEAANLDMRSKFERDGTRVDLGRHLLCAGC